MTLRRAALAAIRSVNPTAPIVETSSHTGTGVLDLLDLLVPKLTPATSPQLQEAP